MEIIFIVLKKRKQVLINKKTNLNKIKVKMKKENRILLNEFKK